MCSVAVGVIFTAGATEVIIDLTASLAGVLDLVEHGFVILVLRDIDGEEASVCLGERVGRPVCVEIDLMLVSQVGAVKGNLGSSPDELEVSLSHRLVKLIEHLPEPLNDLAVLAAGTIIGNGFKGIGLNVTTAASLLDLVPVQEGEDVQIDDLADTFLDPFHLVLSLVESCLHGQVNELLVILMSNLLLIASGAESHSLLVGKDSCEVQVCLCIKVFWLLLFGVPLKIFESRQGVLVEAIEILHAYRVTNQLLPEQWSKVPVHD